MLANFKIETIIMPGGCTKYVQAPDVVWNRPFKDRIQEQYDWWANAKHECMDIVRRGYLSSPFSNNPPPSLIPPPLKKSLIPPSQWYSSKPWM